MNKKRQEISDDIAWDNIKWNFNVTDSDCHLTVIPCACVRYGTLLATANQSCIQQMHTE